MPNEMNHAEVAETLELHAPWVGGTYHDAMLLAAADERRIANGEYVPAPVKCGECKYYLECDGGLCAHPKLQCEETPITQKERSCSYGERKEGTK